MSHYSVPVAQVEEALPQKLEYLNLQQDEENESLKMIVNNDERRMFVKKMARHAWKAYAHYAWGQDALEPITKSANQVLLGPNGALSLIQALSTLHVMGFNGEYERARDWFVKEFNFSTINQPVNVFIIVTEIIGSLLSNYALTKDKIFLNKAHHIARIIAPAYETIDGLPYKMINPSTGIPAGNELWLEEAGGQWLEYKFLTNATGDGEIGSRIENIRQFFQRVNKPKGLYLASLDSSTGEWTSDRSTLFTEGSTFYSYLIKAFVQSGGRDIEALKDYQEAISAVDRNLLIHNSKPGDLVFVRDHDIWTGEYGEFMRIDSCHLGAMLALGSDAQRNIHNHQNLNFTETRWQQQKAIRHLRMAQEIAQTCYFASILSGSGLPPAYMFFHEIKSTPEMSYNRFSLFSELAETYFILWRLTHENNYREHAWKLVESLWHHTRISSGGFSNILNVDQIPTDKTNYQPPQFLGATLKYLYLIFTDDQVLPLDQWVFNRVGQPLPICGQNTMLPALKCK